MDPSPPDFPRLPADLVARLARELGFDLVGIAPVEPSRYADAYRAWIAHGHHGEMSYLARNLDERLDLTKKFPWAKSVISVAISYWQEAPSSQLPQSPDPSTPHSSSLGRIARYAWGRDYHRVLGRKLELLENRLRAALAPLAFETRTYSDTGPILEREFAARAGLGWIGKHTLLIHPKHGSWFLLGEMITSLAPPLAAVDTPPQITDHCGTCTRCIDACPTDAITPYHVDATRCISYQTLENRGPIPTDLHAPIADAGFIVGCDICQEVCPFNRRPLPTHEPDFALQDPAPAVPLSDVLAWNEHDWDVHTRGHAHRRAKFSMWQRNAQILSDNAEPQKTNDPSQSE